MSEQNEPCPFPRRNAKWPSRSEAEEGGRPTPTSARRVPVGTGELGVWAGHLSPSLPCRGPREEPQRGQDGLRLGDTPARSVPSGAGSSELIAAA